MAADSLSNVIRRPFFAFLLVLATLAMPMYPHAVASAGQSAISVVVDGLPVSFSVAPIIRDGTTLVPFRAIAEAIRVKVEWDGATSTVIARDGMDEIRLTIGNRTAYHNGTPVTLDVAPVIENGSTLIPVRFFSTSFGCRVEWDGAARAVLITSPAREMAVIGFYALGDSRTSSWIDLFGTPYPDAGAGNTSAVSELALGWYSLDQRGTLLTRSSTGWQRPDGWENVLAAAQTYRLRTEMTVHMTDRAGELTALLADGAAVTAAADAIALEAEGYGGVNLDLEGLGLTDQGEALQQVRQRFTDLVAALRQRLSPGGKTLTLTLHPLNSAYRGYDYAALAEYADRIIVMAYDYGTKPEPIDKVSAAVDLALQSLPAEKLVLGISAPSETAESLAIKVGLAKRRALQGIALWRLGLLSPEMWDALRATAIATRQ